MSNHGGYRVVRRKPQVFVGECNCGWVGVGPKSGRPFWQSIEAAIVTVVHARDNGEEISIVDVKKVDLQPQSNRGGF